MTNTTNPNTSPRTRRGKEKKNTRESTFNALMLKTVDEIFSSFGRSCKQALYFQLKNTFNIKKKEIPLKTEEFAKALEQIFGIGAKFIEMQIIVKLHKKTPNFRYASPMADLVFAEYVASLRRYFISTHCESNRCLRMQRKQNALQIPRIATFCSSTVRYVSL